MMRFTLMMTALLALGLTPAQAAEQLLRARELNRWQEEARPHLLIDVRNEGHFRAAHLPQAMNIPGFVIGHKPLPETMDIVLYDNELSGRLARQAAEKLSGKVPETRIFILTGGLRGWDAEGFPVVRAGGEFDPALENTITAEDLRAALLLGTEVDIVDLRDSGSYKTRSIGGARNLPLIKSPEALAKTRSDVFADLVELPSAARTRLAERDVRSSGAGVAEEALAELILQDTGNATRSRRSPASTPVVLVDESGTVATRLMPYLRTRSSASSQQFLVLERGMVAWEATGPLTPERGTHTVVHGSSELPAPAMPAEQ